MGFWKRLSRKKKTLLLMAVTAIAAGVTAIAEVLTGNLPRGRLYRPKDSEKTEYGLEWSADSPDEKQGKVNISVNRQPPGENEIEEVFRYGEEYLRTLYPEDCVVTGDLDFKSKVADTGIKLIWEPENYLYVNTDGTRRDTDTGAEGQKLAIKVTMSAYGEKRDITLNVLLKRADENLTFGERLNRYIHELEQDTGKEWIELPRTFEGVDISWNKAKTHNALKLLLLIPLIPVFVFLKESEDRRSAGKERDKALMDEYPEVVSKMLLLLEAGLTVRAAWGHIVKNMAGDAKKAVLCEEMKIAFNEMENGVSEHAACENFGKRCRLLPYMRFAGLLGQNLTKGSVSVLPLLEQEAIDAFEERKEAAKRAGEEAGTKLLIPMAGMLVIILAMIMYAAFQSI